MNEARSDVVDLYSAEHQMALLNGSGHEPKPWQPVSPSQHTYVGIYLIFMGEFRVS